MGNNKITKWNNESFIRKAKNIHGDLYDYSNVEYKSYHEKVIIVDPIYGEFLQSPANHFKGKGSPKRAKQKLSIKFSLTTEKFIEKARKIHGNLYDYSKVNYINNRTKVIIIDPEHGEFLQTPHNHLKGNKCYKQYKCKKLTTEEFIEKSKTIHNNLYDYSKVNYINSQTKVIIIDPIYGEFLQTPNKHLNGQGHISRGKIKITNTKKYNNKIFIEKARKVHGDLYDYSKVNYIHSRTEVIIIDPIYGEFLQKPELHIRGCGNPKRITANKVKDHIIPLSIIMSSKERILRLHKDRPLFKLLNSELNINYIDFSKNLSKSDKIILNNKQYSAKNYRNNYKIISILLENIIDKEEIHDIIDLDKKYMEKYNEKNT